MREEVVEKGGIVSMAGPASYKLAVVSDLHLSEGWDENGYLSRNEDFFFDNNFKRFLDHLAETGARGKFSYRLIINGDFVDFLQFTTVPEGREIGGQAITKKERELGLGANKVKTLWKLDLLINGHKILFTALADFADKGNEIFIIPGNHDIEWVMPEVQEAFKTRLSELATPPSGGMKDRIRFLPWFYFDPLLSVFVEHGSQYDDINSFDYLLCPYRKDNSMDLPAGSFFVRYLFNRVEEIFPFADNMKPMTKFIGWAILHARTYRHIRKFIRFFLDTIGKAGPVEESWARELEKRHAEEMAKLGNSSGINTPELYDLKKHWVPSALHHRSKVGLVASFFKNSGLDKTYYRCRAKTVQEVLGTRYVIFGHTHESDLCAFPKTGKREYINSGSWTRSFAADYEEALLKSENEFVYVHVGYDERKKDIKMDLLRWNDGLHEGERVRLFKERKQSLQSTKTSHS